MGSLTESSFGVAVRLGGLLFVVADRRSLLAAPEAALVGQVGADDEHREEEKREQRLPPLDDVRTEAREDQHQPHVGEHARRRRQEEHLRATSHRY